MANLLIRGICISGCGCLAGADGQAAEALVPSVRALRLPFYCAPGGGLAGGLTDGALNAAAGGEEITTLTGTVAMDGLAAPIALAGFAYDLGGTSYGYFGACRQ